LVAAKISDQRHALVDSLIGFPYIMSEQHHGGAMERVGGCKKLVSLYYLRATYRWICIK